MMSEALLTPRAPSRTPAPVSLGDVSSQEMTCEELRSRVAFLEAKVARLEADLQSLRRVSHDEPSNEDDSTDEEVNKELDIRHIQ